MNIVVLTIPTELNKTVVPLSRQQLANYLTTTTVGAFDNGGPEECDYVSHADSVFLSTLR